MPRLGPVVGRKSVYWWSPKLDALRTEYGEARRSWLRARRDRNPDARRLQELYRVYRNVGKKLQIGILDAKKRSWDDFLHSLNKDPWGRPYKNVVERIKSSGAGAQRLAPDLLKETVRVLFHEEEEVPGISTERLPENEDMEAIDPITESELSAALMRVKKGVAPGPGGVPNVVWRTAGGILAARMYPTLNACLRHGWFPPQWKRARLTLLRKPGKTEDVPSAFRPLCILDETGKILERIILARLEKHLAETGPNLSDGQYGFRRKRSTMDAILRVRQLCEGITSGGGCAIAISLDISNAFNSLPHPVILEALRRHRVPAYLVKILRSFLEDRVLLMEEADGSISSRRITRGVPQGSNLSPTLWNIGYDSVLQTRLPDNSWVIGYADDTLVVVGDTTWKKTIRKAVRAATMILEEIEKLGLKVSVAKSEAMYFQGRRTPPPPQNASLVLGADRVPIKGVMKYLGIHLDARWKFTHHFQVLLPTTMKMADGLRGLMPNLGGPCTAVRRLYGEVIKSKILYGAPIWLDEVARNQRIRRELNQLEKKMATRIIRSYRTVARGAAMALAGFQPLLLLAKARKSLYELRKANLAEAGNVDAFREGALRIRYTLYEEWKAELEAEEFGRWTLDSALRCWAGWQESLPPISYRLAQILTGHGCLGKYLHKIGKEMNASCHHCGAGTDSAEHTLVECPTWEEERTGFKEETGKDVSLLHVMEAMIKGGKEMRAAWKLAELIVRQKEEAERERERNGRARPRRWRRGRPPRGEGWLM